MVSATAEITVQDIQERMKALEEQRAYLQELMQARKEEAKAGLLDQIRDLAASAELDLNELVAALMPKSAPSAGRVRKPRNSAAETAPGAYPTYRLLTNPERTYIRGVLPAWFKEAMATFGLDATKRADREKFKAEHMRREAA